MKIPKYTLIVLVFFACLLPVMAQDGPGGVEYVSATGRFKIRFPDVPEESENTYEMKPGQIVTHFVKLATDVTHAVNYTDYPTNMENPEVVKRFLDNARDVALLRVAKDEPRVLSETDVSMDGHADLGATWKEFSSTEGKFKIKFPATPYQALSNFRKN